MAHVPEEPHVILEILPLIMQNGRIKWIQRNHDEAHGAWHIPYDDSRHQPNDAVLQALRVFFGHASLNEDSLIVHSTSWRHLPGIGIILTYVAVMPQPNAFAALSQVHEHMTLVDVTHVLPQAHSDNLHAPTRIRVEQVITHALRHMAWLSRGSASVTPYLTYEWLSVLARHAPEPAGQLPLAQPLNV